MNVIAALIKHLTFMKEDAFLKNVVLQNFLMGGALATYGTAVKSVRKSCIIIECFGL